MDDGRKLIDVKIDFINEKSPDRSKSISFREASRSIGEDFGQNDCGKVFVKLAREIGKSSAEELIEMFKIMAKEFADELGEESPLRTEKALTRALNEGLLTVLFQNEQEEQMFGEVLEELKREQTETTDESKLDLVH